MTGGELFDFVNEKGPIPEVLCKQLFTQLINGVHYLHQRNIVHRDLVNISFVTKITTNIRYLETRKYII